MDNTDVLSSEHESEIREDAQMPQENDLNGAAQSEEKPKAGGYRLIAVLTFLLTVGGLFIGYLGKFLPDFLNHNSYLTGGVTGALAGTLLGWCIQTVTDAVANLSALASDTQMIADLALILLLAAAVLSSLICLILTFAKARSAKQVSYNGAKISALSYLLLALWVFCHGTLNLDNTSAVTDVLGCADLLLLGITLLILILLSVSACLHDKPSNGVLHLIGLIVTVVAAVALCYPGTTAAKMLVEHDFSHPETVVTYALAIIIFFNIVVAIFNLGNTKCAPFHIVRNALMFIAAVVYIVFLAIDNLLAKDGDLLPSILLALCTFCAVTIPATVFFVKRYRENKEKAAAAAKAAEEAAQAEEAARAAEEAQRQAELEAQAALEEPEVPAEEHVMEDPDFARNMALYASGLSPDPLPEPQGDPHRYDTDRLYTYDPFINTLTPEEKNEFGDLFIAKKNGTYGDLPRYVIGGDNSTFFHKVWIHYSAYDMTPRLKEKLYLYIRSISAK